MPESLFGGIPTPKGFTDTSLQDYYNALKIPIEMDTARNRGRARTEAYASGLGGTPTETGGVAAADYYGGLRKDQALGDMGFRLAGLSNQDARFTEGNQFQAGESRLGREHQTSLTRLQAELNADAENTKNRRDMQASLWQLPLKLGAGVLGSFAGGWGAGKGMGAGVGASAPPPRFG